MTLIKADPDSDTDPNPDVVPGFHTASAGSDPHGAGFSAQIRYSIIIITI